MLQENTNQMIGHNHSALSESIARLNDAMERIVADDAFGELARDLVKHD